MRIEVKKLRTDRRVALCVVALTMAALVQGCVQSAPTGGDASVRSQTQPVFVQPSPVQTAQPTPTQAPAVESPLPPPKGFVNDFANVIDAETESQLEARLRRLKARTNIEIGVVTVETTGERDISDYSLAVAKGWGIGPPAGEDGGGLLLLLAVKDRKWRLQVSDRLRGDLPDDVAAALAEVMTPSLRAGRYGEAVNSYLDGIIKRLAERRGFSMKEDEISLQALPEETPQPAERPNVADGRKSAPRGKS